MGGDIIYISSKNSVFAGPNNIAYSATKADQAHQVRLLAAELGEHGIKVNGINPDGVVRGSGIFAGGWGAKRAAVYGVPEEELGQYYAQRTLLKREVLPENIANAAFALCTSDFSHTTGLHVPVDAGVAPPSCDESVRRTGQLAAVDLGATSGRVMLATVGPGISGHPAADHASPTNRSICGTASAPRCTGTSPGCFDHVCNGLAEATRQAADLAEHRGRFVGRRLRAAPSRSLAGTAPSLPRHPLR